MERLSFFRKFEYGITVLALFVYSTSILALVLSGGTIQQNETVVIDSSLILLTFMMLYAVIGVLALCQWKRFLVSLRGDVVILPLIAFACLSYFWSDAPDLTIRRLVALLGTSVFGIYLASRFSMRQQLYLLACTFGLIILGSLVFAVALPSYGVSAGLHEGAWRGVFIHKNGLGMRMVSSAIVFFLLAVGERKQQWLYALGFFASILLLIMSQSGTGIVTLIVVLFALPVYRILALKGSLKIALGLLAALTAIAIPLGYIWISLSDLLALIGKDLTLTGRVDIWPIAIRSIGQRPMLGYGYEAFWRGLEGPSSAFHYAGEVGATHAHNGILQLWLALGFVGVVLFLCGLWINILRSVAYLHSDTSAESYWPAAFFTVLILTNLVESSVLEYNNISWVLYCSISLSLSNWFMARKRRFTGSTRVPLVSETNPLG